MQAFHALNFAECSKQGKSGSVWYGDSNGWRGFGKAAGMADVSVEQVRAFRLQAHHLDGWRPRASALEVVGACGMQNSPPGTWETALANRIEGCSSADALQLLYGERSFMQTWSLRGAPYVFPTAEADAFLTALVPERGEPWIYTDGIGLALDALEIGFGEALALVLQAMPRLDEVTIASKVALDQTLADWVEPLLPPEKRAAWRSPSMYGNPDKQTVGGAAVSFLLRPCAFLGLVTFGERDDTTPTFTSFKRWTGHALDVRPDAQARLVRKFLHCYGPATSAQLGGWLGCSGVQARRLWATVADELEPVCAAGSRAFVLASDRERLCEPPAFPRDLLLLGAHDPYLDQRNRATLQSDKALQRRIWRTVANPGAIVLRGEVVGLWTTKKKGSKLETALELWSDEPDRTRLQDLAEAHAAARNLELASTNFA